MLQCWDNQGRRTLRLDSQVLKFLGVATVGWSTTGAQQSGTIVDDRFTAYAQHVGFAIPMSGSIDFNGYAVQLRVDGNVLTWSYRETGASLATRPDTTFMYGIR